MTSRSAGWTVLMGGSGPEGMVRSIMRRFVELAGGAVDARVAIVPTASEQRAETIERYENAFELEDVHHIEVIDIRTHHQADEPEMLQAPMTRPPSSRIGAAIQYVLGSCSLRSIA